MNAPAKISHLISLGDLYDFAECCEDHAWFYANHWISLQTAVDNLQGLADRWGLIEDLGQDAVQQMMSYEQEINPPELSEYETNYIQHIITRWEATDATRPRPAARTEDRYRPASSTIDAFFFVARSQDAAYLARWLADHPQDAAHLHKLWTEKCSLMKK
jgi:hypothetical protein